MVEGHAHVAVVDVIVVARLGHDLDTLSFARHDEHAVRAHDEEDVGDAARRGEPLLAVDHPLVAVLHGRGLKERRIRSALRLGHRVGGEHLLIEERLEPALLLLLGPVRREHLHVARVRRRRAEELGRRGILAKDLVHEAELELTEAGTAELLVEEERPEPLILHVLLEVLHIRANRRVRKANRMREDVAERRDLLLTELLDPIELLLEFGLGREIPCHGCASFRSVSLGRPAKLPQLADLRPGPEFCR